MNEQQMRSKLREAIEEVMPNAVVFRLEDMYTAGVPDIPVTNFGRTLWVEAKAPDVTSEKRSRKLQRLNMVRLSGVGFAVYVDLYDDRVEVVHPGTDARGERGEILARYAGSTRYVDCAHYLKLYMQRRPT